MLVNVSDLYDAFHEIIDIARARFGLNDETEPSLAELADQLEVDLFLPACARRSAMIARREIESEEVGAMIRLRDVDGSIRPGAAGRFHSHGFDDVDARGAVPNTVLAANLMPRPRDEVELIIMIDQE
jgi:hypothetical protein